MKWCHFSLNPHFKWEMMSFDDFDDYVLEKLRVRWKNNRNHSTYLGYYEGKYSLSNFVRSAKEFTWFYCFAWTSSFSTAQISSTNHIWANIFTGPISIRNTLFSCKDIHRQILQSFWYISIVWTKNKSILELVLTVTY